MSYIKRWIEDIYTDLEDGKTVEEICKKYHTTKENVEEVAKLMNIEEES